VGKPERKRALVKPRLGGMMILKCILGLRGMDWIDLAENKDM
jgi:hypothetical protein